MVNGEPGAKSAASRGRLRIYLGAAPGVGKTFAMLGEGRRRRDRGTDIVVGLVETHGRPSTAAALDGLEVLPRRSVSYRGTSIDEMDVEAILTRRPHVVLIDELAHTNVPGSERTKRWEDIEVVLAAGIDVISTLNIQHLESLNDVVAQITGVEQRETVPDAFVRAADQVELVDMSPEALRRRLAHGNVYAAEKVDAALSNYFRVGNLTALRELALLWLADNVEAGLRDYRKQHGIDTAWETRERIVVALTGGPEGDTVIRRAARIAVRAVGAELMAVHVARSDGLAGGEPALLERQRRLVESLGGSFHTVLGEDVPDGLLAFARGANATQLVLGVTRSGPWRAWLGGGSVESKVVRDSGDIDVHLVTHESASRRTVLPRLHSRVNVRRQLIGALTAIVTMPLLTVLLAESRGVFNYSSELLAYLLLVVTIAAIGGLGVGVVSAVAAALAMNWFFTEPVGTWTITERDNVITLLAFVLVAAAISVTVDLAARRASQAARASAEAGVLATLSADVLRPGSTPGLLLDRMVETFGFNGAAVYDSAQSADAAALLASGAEVKRGEAGLITVAAPEDLLVVASGPSPQARDRRLLEAFATTVATVLHNERLALQAAQAEPVLAADRTRTALLRAVSHDLRAPLSAAKAAVTGLRATDIDLSEGERQELLEATDLSLDRLAAMIADLLDVSRLEAGALTVLQESVDVGDLAQRVVNGIEGYDRVHVEAAHHLPAALVDPVLLERVLANLIENALRHARSDHFTTVGISSAGGVIEIRVVDRGQGLSDGEKEQMFLPFQRMGDRNPEEGTGLGLALVKGFVEAMDGSVWADDTPGGGLTVVVRLPCADADLVDETLIEEVAQLHETPLLQDGMQ